LDESHIAAVIDPAGGSWYVEALTDALARTGWEQFQSIEESGGIAAALADGSIAQQLATSRAERERKLAVREDAITGVSEFPAVGETLVVREPAPPVPSGGLPRMRWAQQHEAMRERADRFTEASGHPPTVLLVPLESARAAAARLSFTGDLLRPAGIAAVTFDGSGDTAGESDLGEALQTNATTVACLCGTDDAYAAAASTVADALRAAGAAKVLLAGQAKAAPAAAIDTFLFRGCDAVAAQEQLLDDLGVSR
jgi:methylmalonyl-CoA mutase